MKAPRYVPTSPGGRRMSRLGYTRLWVMLAAEPRTSTALAEAAGLGAQRCREILWAMVRVRTLDVIRWERPTLNGLYVPVFAPGLGVIAPYPGNLGLRRRAGTGAESRKARGEMVSFGVMMAGLRDGQTVLELAEACGASSVRIGACVKVLRQAGAVFIATWERPTDRGQWLQVWELGSGQDARKPVARTRAEIMATVRAKRKAQAIHAAMCGIVPGRAANDGERAAA